jgi:hypothetical protein
MMILFLKRSKNTASDGQEEPRLWLDTCMHKGIVELTKLQGTVAQCAGILPPRAGSKDMHCYGSSTLVEIASIDEGRVSISKTD